MKPIIGLLCEVDDERDTKALNTYVNAVELVGGLPIVLPYVKNDDNIANFVELCDGFFFTGGTDINPNRYKEEDRGLCKKSQEFRDELEFKVIEKAIKTQKPIIAICRGAQLVNVFFGGTLYQDISTETNATILHQQVEPKFALSHSVRVLENTPLYELVGKREMPANSFHHQAVKKLGENLCVMALSCDNIVEGFYLKGNSYLRCYQWHPERLCESDELNKRIFEDFIKAVKNDD